MDAASRQRATRRIVSGDSHTQAPCPSWSVFEWGTSSSPDPSSCASINSTATATSRSEEHTSELQSLMRISYAVFCLKKKKKIHNVTYTQLEQLQHIIISNNEQL